jgi:copper chaperone CopZ
VHLWLQNFKLKNYFMTQLIKYISIAIITLCSNNVIAQQTVQITKAELTVTGLTCSMCSKATHKKLETVNSIQSITANIKTTSFTLTFKPDASIDINDIKKKVEDAGFAVGSLVLYIKGSGVFVQNNTTITAGNAQYTFIQSYPKTIEGEAQARVLDKGFITKKEYAKMAKTLATYPSYGKAVANQFHVRIL